MNTDNPAASSHQRERLLATQEQLTRRLEALKLDPSMALERNAAEHATQLENRDVVLALTEEARAELAEVKHALRHLDSGEYGVCVQCGEPIALERLDAYPAASRCMDCAA